MEEEDAIAGGLGEAGRPLKVTVTAGESDRSGTVDRPGGAAASGGATSEATSVAVDKAGAGGHHGEISEVRERVAGRRENPTGESSGVGGEGGRARPTQWLASPPE